ncbi:MAG: hypothetical protein DI600_05365, partial [Cutibacterium granulosum]
MAAGGTAGVANEIARAVAPAAMVTTTPSPTCARMTSSCRATESSTFATSTPSSVPPATCPAPRTPMSRCPWCDATVCARE